MNTVLNEIRFFFGFKPPTVNNLSLRWMLTVECLKPEKIEFRSKRYSFNSLFTTAGLTYNTSGYFASCVAFLRPRRGVEKYYATRKISARIIC